MTRVELLAAMTAVIGTERKLAERAMSHARGAPPEAVKVLMTTANYHIQVASLLALAADELRKS